MNIGIIIFVVSVIFTIIGAINDDSHKKRKNQKPPINKQPNQSEAQPKKRGFLEEIGKTFSDLEKQLNEGPFSEEKRSPQQDKPVETRAEKMENQTTQQDSPSTQNHRETEADKLKREQKQQDDKIQKELEDELMGRIQNVRNEIDRETENKIQRTEKQARAIISDKYLSERTKRYRLKQLMNAHSVQSSGTNAQYRFAEDEVVNGIIWSEVLGRPKKL
ncbi:hypothetical protein [Staphylococcus nepalensis]|uniref:hypothetical protein n=1 Tax=Staphylococcus nepalensis TaxID=214473 RepID=UPI001A989519|nr:hypothetical protein [Staphylococcus nepalensis]MBO1221467.1 hypothetical protein [Staphylococcus nepalensis]